MKRFILPIILLFSIQVFSQEATQSDTLRKDALNVFMEASDYVRKEIPYVNYVRDIRDAGVYIIRSFQRTGSGGDETTFFLIGQHEYTGMLDTLSFVTTPDETTEGRREKEVATLKMGLTRYVARTPLAKYLKITFSEPLSETVSTDKWDSWVFKGSFNGFLDGQKTYKTSYVSGNFSANRITQDWKINLSARYSYSQDKITIEDTTGITEIFSYNSSKSFNGLIVKSISDHWSVGGSVLMGASSFSNEKIMTGIMPAIEYDLFPYSESTRRQLRLLYRIGFNHVNYIDSTIYNKLNENLWQHTFSAAYEVIQKWGSIYLNLDFSNYFHDWSKNNLSLSGFLNLRITKGLNVNFGGGASLIHDQIGLVKGDVATEEILLRRKELATQYQYFTSFGLTYTFGSIYNNVVNPRFGNSGGGGMTILMN
ncbi:MAG: hypothetical protein WAL29_01495 [Bacteroidales bacterium]